MSDTPKNSPDFDDADPHLGIEVRDLSLFHLSLAGIFPEWSSNRISKWLKINPRTLQRMLSKRDDIHKPIPDGLRARIKNQQEFVQEFGLGAEIDDLITDAKAAGIDDEVIGAWLAHRYKRLMGRDID